MTWFQLLGWALAMIACGFIIGYVWGTERALQIIKKAAEEDDD